jgi:hypothetical protein
MIINLRLVLVCSLFLLFSCKKYKPADAAFFIKAANVSVAANNFTQGSGSHNISDLWLYVNGQFQGTYPSGNLMPIVLKDGHSRISVYAGIKNNGIAKTRIPWVFYDRFDLDTTVEAGKTIERSFAFKYNSSTVFAFTENFDGAGVKLIKSPISEVPFTTTASEGFEGKSLKLELSTPSESIGQVESNDFYILPYSTANVYLEINYKCNAEFAVGIIGTNQVLRPVVYVNPETTWNKIYISLATEVNSPPTSTSYKVYFRMLRTDGRTDVLNLFLDNIKLVYI